MGRGNPGLIHETQNEDGVWDSNSFCGGTAPDGGHTSPRAVNLDDVPERTPQVYVHFVTDMPDPFKLPDAPISVPSSFQRLDLSKVRDLGFTGTWGQHLLGSECLFEQTCNHF